MGHVEPFTYYCLKVHLPPPCRKNSIKNISTLNMENTKDFATF